MPLFSLTGALCANLGHFTPQKLKLCGQNRAFLDVVYSMRTADVNKWINAQGNRKTGFILEGKQWGKISSIFSVFLPAKQMSSQLATSSWWRQMWGSRRSLNICPWLISCPRWPFIFVPFFEPFVFQGCCCWMLLKFVRFTTFPVLLLKGTVCIFFTAKPNTATLAQPIECNCAHPLFFPFISPIGISKKSSLKHFKPWTKLRAKVYQGL